MTKKRLDCGQTTDCGHFGQTRDSWLGHQTNTCHTHYRLWTLVGNKLNMYTLWLYRYRLVFVCSVQCAVWSVQCVACCVMCTFCSVKCTLCSVKCAVIGVPFVVWRVRCVVYNVRYAVCNMYSPVCQTVKTHTVTVCFPDKSQTGRASVQAFLQKKTKNIKRDPKVLKNPAYGRHQLSRPMRIVGPIQIWRGSVIKIYIYIFFFF